MNVRMKTRALLALSVLAVIGCHHLGAPPPEGEGEAEAGPAEEDTDTCTGGQFIGHVLVETPEELAELAGITGIGWDLKIQCPDCDVLSVLGCLTSVGGVLAIGATDEDSTTPQCLATPISQLHGLHNVTSVGSLVLFCNDNLTDITSLENLTSVGDNLHVGRNAALTSLEGLDGIDVVGGGLFIKHNPSLTSVEGLDGLSWVMEGASIEDNPSLVNLDGLGTLAAVGEDIYIWDNPSLNGVDGFSELLSVGGTVILGNNGITDVDGLSGLTSLSGLWIEGNSDLADLDGLSGATTVLVELRVITNETLPDCEVCELLDQLTTAPEILNVQDNLADECTPVPAGCP